VLQGLATLGLGDDHPALRKAADWLESVQQSDGGWGETCASYDDRSLMGQGETTASQTAWAVLALVSAGRAQGDAVRRGVEYLRETQRPDGSWDEGPYTGTGFPKVFYLKYHLYRIYFPLMALARYQRAMSGALSAAATPGALACGVPAAPGPVGI
jgi:squalene-hopene/tetraprenyl-beta-curcumene cyclase